MKKYLIIGLLICIIVFSGCKCIEREDSCCKGMKCEHVELSCVEGYQSDFKGCDDTCKSIVECEEI
ncbi:hypothetical protein ACFL96_08425 [Thermoproteota archaeon]